MAAGELLCRFLWEACNMTKEELKNAAVDAVVEILPKRKPRQC